MVHDPYKLLAVPYDVDELTVRKRYRAAAKDHHPNAGGHEEDFRLLKEAFDQIIFNIRNNIRFVPPSEAPYRPEQPKTEAAKKPPPPPDDRKRKSGEERTRRAYTGASTRNAS